MEGMSVEYLARPIPRIVTTNAQRDKSGEGSGPLVMHTRRRRQQMGVPGSSDESYEGEAVENESNKRLFN